MPVQDLLQSNKKGWWFGLAPATMEFWVLFPNERNQGKQENPVLKYRVPLRVPMHAPSRAPFHLPVRLSHNIPFPRVWTDSSTTASARCIAQQISSTLPLPPREELCNKQQHPGGKFHACAARLTVKRAAVAGMFFTFKTDIPTPTSPLFTDASSCVDSAT
jgi:hypothetical protein